MSVRACPSRKDRRLAAHSGHVAFPAAFIGQNVAKTGQKEGRPASTWKLKHRVPRRARSWMLTERALGQSASVCKDWSPWRRDSARAARTPHTRRQRRTGSASRRGTYPGGPISTRLSGASVHGLKKQKIGPPIRLPPFPIPIWFAVLVYYPGDPPMEPACNLHMSVGYVVIWQKDGTFEACRISTTERRKATNA